MKTQTIAFPPVRTRAADFLALAKPRLNLLVIATAGAGYYMGVGEALDPGTFLHTVSGTALVAGGAAALNQVAERDVDGRMQRTRLRPMPDGRLQPGEARRFGLGLSALGLLQLGFGANLLAAAVALATLVSYVSIYTPLKRRTSAATVIGAVPGALPPVVGWAAARGALTIEAVALFAIVFLWQMPHFLALAWMYRDDFARAGFPFLPVIDPAGRRTARQVLWYASALLPVSLVPAVVGLTGGAYLIGASLLGVGFVVLALRFAVSRTSKRARSLFLGSLVYLPLLWALMIADRAL